MNSVYKGVVKYLTAAGLMRQLREHMQIEEKDHFGTRNISKSGLALLDAVHCVHDRKRTEAFLKEITVQTRADSIVIEAGTGTGILSFFAATRAERVYGVEINRRIHSLAQKIQKYLLKQKVIEKKVHFYLADATKVCFPEKADVIINENIYTGLFFEKQVQIARHLQKYLKRGGVMIPEVLRSYIVLCEVKAPQPLKKGEMIVPLQNRHVSIQQLSKPHQYDAVHLSKSIGAGVRTIVRMRATRTGTMNAVLIFTEVHMPSGARIRRNETEFLNNDIVLGLAATSEVRKGQSVELSIAYPYGGKPDDARIKPVILRA